MNANMQKLMLDSLCNTLSSIMPRTVRQAKLVTAPSPWNGSQMGVSIGYASPVSLRMVIDGERDMFGRMGEMMFGMQLEGEMLDSCVGEMANMLAGGTTTILGGLGIATDISPPLLLQSFDGEGRGVALPVEIEEVGSVRIMLLADE